MRANLDSQLKNAIKAKDTRRMSTLRLILAAVKDRDTRPNQSHPITDEEIIELLATMIKQRKESQKIYEEAGRLELAQQEQEEIVIIREFMPAQMEEEDIVEACKKIINSVGATGLKDMGKVMGALKKEYAGQMDFGLASKHVKELLA